MIKDYVLTSAVLAVCVLTVGCGTLGNISSQRPEVYGGVKNNAEVIRTGLALTEKDALQPIIRSSFCIPVLGFLMAGLSTLDMPFSIVGDTLLYPAIKIKRDQSIRQQKDETEHGRRMRAIYERHKFEDGPFVPFEDVLANPAGFSNQVLRSGIIFYRSQAKQKRSRTMVNHDSMGFRDVPVFVAGAEDTKRSESIIRYWCSGKPESKGARPDWVILSSRNRVVVDGSRAGSVEGSWEVEIRKDATEPDFPVTDRSVWRGNFNISRSSRSRLQELQKRAPDVRDGESLHIGYCTQVWNTVGVLWGRVTPDGVFRGSVILDHLPDATQRGELELKISPYNDIGAGRLELTQNTGETKVYSMRLLRIR